MPEEKAPAKPMPQLEPEPLLEEDDEEELDVAAPGGGAVDEDQDEEAQLLQPVFSCDDRRLPPSVRDVEAVASLPLTSYSLAVEASYCSSQAVPAPHEDRLLNHPPPLCFGHDCYFTLLTGGTGSDSVEELAVDIEAKGSSTRTGEGDVTLSGEATGFWGEFENSLPALAPLPLPFLDFFGEDILLSIYFRRTYLLLLLDIFYLTIHRHNFN